MAKRTLDSAKNGKKDEFYTQLSDIEKEIRHYKDQLKDKVIFCNCDDPEESNFFKFFVLQFEFLGIKKLISTHFKESQPSYKLEVTKQNLDKVRLFDQIDIDENAKILLEQNGDFRSGECVELLKESDIIITNPPFSLFREYVAQLMKYKKKFLIIGNQNAITYKEVFELIRKNKIWLGYHNNQSFVYKTPYPNKLESNRKFVIQKGYNPDEGYVKVPAINWYTNLDISKRNDELTLYKVYSEAEFPMYDNYDAINVDKVVEIPTNYLGKIGVPITYLDKYNPKQFEIVGLSRYIETQGMSQKFVDKYYKTGQTGSISEGHPDLCYYDSTGKPVVPYMRIIIRKKV